MRFGITVNIGNYQSLRFDSSEHETLDQCIDEIINCLRRFNDNQDVALMQDYLAAHSRGN